MNDLFLTRSAGGTSPTDRHTVPPASLARQRNGFKFNGKISSIRTPSEHVLLVCQDEQTHGRRRLQAERRQVGRTSVGDHVAARHENKFKSAEDRHRDTRPNINARGNVGFCDGHAEFMSRKDAISQRYSGHPLPDPAGLLIRAGGVGTARLSVEGVVCDGERVVSGEFMIGVSRVDIRHRR